ncbi:MAG: GNAT family N-acetyltransferase [Parachlamydiaceae bacterium]|nr:GNAT family N-acetyltransferase [Parachlamydiaceae bacterium]
MTSKTLILQILQEEDLPGIISTFNFPWTSLQATQEKWERYYAEQQRSIRIVYLVKIQNQCVGYGNLLWISEYPGFKEGNIPEINDVWILDAHRGNGFGTKLIQHLEGIARQHNHKQIGIGVGLYKDYGSAQKLYVQMGYVPDKNGVTYKCQPVVPGDSYPVDDDLIIWLKKDLSTK